MENENRASRLEALPREQQRPGESAPAAPLGSGTMEPAKKGRPFVMVGLIVGVMLAAIGAYLVWTAGEEDTDDAQVMADMVPVGTRVAGQVVEVRGAGGGQRGATGDDRADDAETEALGQVAEHVVVGHEAAAVLGEVVGLSRIHISRPT